MAPDAIPLRRHELEAVRNAESWARKPLLRKIYGSFYAAMRGRLAPAELGPCLEIGSGSGLAKRFLPECITSDLFARPGVDRIESAYALRFPDASLGNLVLLDVWHHLEFPGAALAEFRRVLRPGGRLVLFEPAAGSVLGRIVYGLFHSEPVDPPGPVDWSPSPAFRPADRAYYSAQGNGWRMFARDALPPEIERTGGWRLVEVRRFGALSYAMSGGFSGPQLYPGWAYPLMRRIDRLLDRTPRLAATRLLVVLERI